MYNIFDGSCETSMDYLFQNKYIFCTQQIMATCAVYRIIATYVFIERI